MAIAKKKFREIVLQVLFSENLVEGDQKELVHFLSLIEKITRKTIREAYHVAQEVRKNQDRIDEMIRKSSREYAFDRISLVERNILRLALFELFFVPGIPEKVVISEAVRLCRKYGTRQSAAFVNALLDSINTQKG